LPNKVKETMTVTWFSLKSLISMLISATTSIVS